MLVRTKVCFLHRKPRGGARGGGERPVWPVAENRTLRERPIFRSPFFFLSDTLCVISTLLVFFLPVVGINVKDAGRCRQCMFGNVFGTEERRKAFSRPVQN